MSAKLKVYRVEVRAPSGDSVAVVQTHLVRAVSHLAAYRHARLIGHLATGRRIRISNISVDPATPEMCVELGAAGVAIEDATE